MKTVYPTLQLLILTDMMSRGRTTAGEQSGMWGEDAHRCKDWLEKFHREGLCAKEIANPAARNPRPPILDVISYVADPGKIRAKLRELCSNRS